MNRKAAKRFLILHVLAVTAAVLFPVYVKIATVVSGFWPGCLLHDLLFIYCPLCGGTRAVSALMGLNFALAWQSNAFVVLVAGVGSIFYVIAWVRLLRGKEKLWILPGWLWISLAVLMIVFGVLRNVLMIGWGVDPLGDLGFVWHRGA